MMSTIKRIVKSQGKFVSKLPFNNYISLSGANLDMGDKVLLKSKIISKGKNNRILFETGGGGSIRNSTIRIMGDNNTVIIGSGCNIVDGDFWIQDDNNEIRIGKDTLICGRTHLACIEGTKIIIGTECLFSSDIVIRTGDSHSLINEQGKRINPSKDIIIGDHVWIGYGAAINKGVTIGDNSVIGTKAVVTKAFEKGSVAIAGNPARIVKEKINWDIDKLQMED